MSRIAFAQADPGNLRKLQTRIIGLLNQHIEQVTRDSGVLAKWIYKVVVVGNTCMHHLLLGIDPSYVGLAPYAPVTAPRRDGVRPRAVSQGQSGGARLPAPAGGRLRRRRRGGRRPGHPHRRHARDPHRGRHRHQWRGAARLARAPLGLLGARRARARRRADPPRDARGDGRHRPRQRRRRRPSTAHDRRVRRAGPLRIGHRRRDRRAARRGHHRLDRAHRRGRPRAAARAPAARGC